MSPSSPTDHAACTWVATIILSILLAVTDATLAQTIVGHIPEEIIVNDAGDWTLKTRSIAPISIDDLHNFVPDQIPVFSYDEIGNKIAGLYFANETPVPIETPSTAYPGIVVLSPDGSWHIEKLYWRIMHYKVSPNQTVFIHGSEDARTFRSDADGILRPIHELPQPREIDVSVTIDESGEPNGLDDDAFARAINLAIGDYVGLLQFDNIGSLDFLIQWASQGPFGGASAVVSGRGERSWNAVRFALEASYTDNDSDSFENAVQANWPLSSTIAYRRPQLTNPDSTSSILLPAPLLSKWYSVDAGDPFVIIINNDQDWDYDSADGISPDAVDLIGSLIHEFGHHFGFVSETESIASSASYDMISGWDVFRFSESDGPAISTSEMGSAVRELRRGSEASAATGLNSASRFFSLATGDDGQSSHWKDFQISDAEYIGIMDVKGSIGVSDLKNGAYLQPSDIQAFDVMGYDIDENNVLPAPGQPTSNTPVPDASVNPNAAIGFTWSAGSNASEYSLYLYDRGPISEPEATALQVESVQEIASTAYNLPASTLFPARRYEWFVTSRNWRGLRQGTPSDFTTQGCVGDWDGSGGAPNSSDFLAFLNDTGALSPRADLNNDSAWNSSDFLIYLNAYNQGC